MTLLIESKRLFIEVPSEAHFATFCEHQSDPHVMQYIGDGPRTSEEVRTGLEYVIKHYEKHGFTFGALIEKESNQCIGQAGLLYLAADDTQPDIEVGYRLARDKWSKGYATEITQEIIKWGFAHLPIKKLVAVIRPENEKSRHVLEKVGMHYVGRDKYHHHEVARYEIEKNQIALGAIELVPATLADWPLIQNMARFYVYDMTRFLGFHEGWELPNDGLYECIDFKKYWQDTHAFPFLIQYKGENVGFAIVDKKGSHADIDFNMAQFFILNKFKHKGISQYVAKKCFDQFRGTWEVNVISGNEAAYRFWRKTVKDYTNNRFQEYSEASFDKGRKNRLRFESK